MLFGSIRSSIKDKTQVSHMELTSRRLEGLIQPKTSFGGYDLGM